MQFSRILAVLSVLLIPLPLVLAQTDGQAALNRELLKAIESKNEAAVRLSLDEGADIEVRSQAGETPLMLAVRNGDAKIVSLLVNRGANVEAKDEYLETPLTLAARHWNSRVLQVLLKKVTDISDKNRALMEATRSVVAVVMIPSSEPAPRNSVPRAEGEEVKKVRLLLESGANIEARDEDGTTPLISASGHGATEIVGLLLARGGRMDAVDDNGNTALIAAACECALATMPSTYDIVKMLLDKGAKVNAQNHQGSTALMSAIGGFGSIEIAELLLARGADATIKDKEGKTALTLAREYDKPEAEAILQKAMQKTH